MLLNIHNLCKKLVLERKSATFPISPHFYSTIPNVLVIHQRQLEQFWISVQQFCPGISVSRLISFNTSGQKYNNVFMVNNTFHYLLFALSFKVLQPSFSRVFSIEIRTALLACCLGLIFSSRNVLCERTAENWLTSCSKYIEFLINFIKTNPCFRISLDSGLFCCFAVFMSSGFLFISFKELPLIFSFRISNVFLSPGFG